MIATAIEFCQSHYIITCLVLLLLARYVLAKMNPSGPFEEYPSNKVISIHSIESWKDEIDKASKEKKLVIVDFYAIWCGPCRYASPIYGKLSAGICSGMFLLPSLVSVEFGDVVFLKVDVDQQRSISQVISLFLFHY
jgi:thiol-disulfide isomerase/thioredoxin